ncbi:MAG: TonB-dependent receptor [Bacteroidota bacterium]
MRKIAIITTGLLLSIQTIAQSVLDRRIDFSVAEIPVADALLSLCEKADLSISFQSRLFQQDEIVTFSYQNKAISFLLEECLKNTEVGFRWQNNRLELYQKPPPIFTISGFVEDSLSGERLVAATVHDQLSGKGTTTNEYGFYSLSIPRGKALLTYAYLGFKSKEYRLNIRNNLRFNVPLKAAITLAEIVVTDKQYAKQAGLSVVDAPNYAEGKLDKIPSVGGEPDIMRYFQSLAGVQSGSGSFGGTHVRGGEADQNLVLLDGVPVYNISHSLGLFSIFEDNMVKSARLYKGKFPAKYGGRLSSVVDIQTKEGNDQAFKFGGAISLFATSAFVEGPIKKDTTSFIVSVRRTHLEPLLDAAIVESDSLGSAIDMNYYFYDINAKVNHTLSNKDRLYVSFYKGADNLRSISALNNNFFLEEAEPDLIPSFVESQSDFININWGNTILSTRWNRVWSDKVFSNLTATYSKFRFNLFGASEFEIGDEEGFLSQVEQYEFNSSIEDIALKVDFDFIKNTQHHLSFGGGLLGRNFRPVFSYAEFEAEEFQFDFGENYFEQDSIIENAQYFATELNFYLEDNIQFTDKLNAQVGFHNAVFVADNAAWLSFQPRLSARYQFHPKGKLYAAYSSMGQFLHVLSPAGITMPFDLWVPSTKKVRPQNSRQTMLGIDWQLPTNFIFSTAVYYKKLNHLITYRNGLDQFLQEESNNFDWENEVTFGEGWNRGAEFSLQRTQGKIKGYLNYTYSKAERKFEGLSNDERFPFRYNRNHELKAGLSVDFSDRFHAFVAWTYGSGQFTTPRIIEFYGDATSFDIFQLDLGTDSDRLNTFQLPANHHLDINLNWHWERPKVDHHLSLGIRNIYNRSNPLFALQYVNLDNPDEGVSENFFGLPIFPSLRYAVKF